MEEKLKADCRFYLGYKPCVYNKKYNVECIGCNFYDQLRSRVLVIKLDAIGDVLRTTSIIPHLHTKFDKPYIVWITREESLPLIQHNSQIDAAWSYNFGVIARLQTEVWDAIINLSNDYASCALASMARLRDDNHKKTGFVLSKDGNITPTNLAARRWLEMAVFDRIKKENSRSYQEIMCAILGVNGPIHLPQLDLKSQHRIRAQQLLSQHDINQNKELILGINTGSGSRWPRKMLDKGGIVQLSNMILKVFDNPFILLLGGALERKKLEDIRNTLNSPRVIESGSDNSLLEFAAYIELCDVLVCGDTLALHMASAMNIPTVALFGPTSSEEIFDYNGMILKIQSKALDCLKCYSDCNKENDCMNTIEFSRILNAIEHQLNY